MRSNKTRYLAPVLLPLLAATALAQSSTATPAAVKTTSGVLKVGTGFDYSTGKYGFTQSTEVWSIPLNLSYDVQHWAFKATIPYLTIKGPASVVAGTAGTEGIPARPTTNTEADIGDVTLSGTYHARPVPGALNIDFTGRVKFGTAPVNKGLGTGETDYYTQVDLYQNFGTITPFATIGYRFLGRNATFELKDGAYVTAGAAFRVSSKTVVGAAYDWRSRIVNGAQNGSDALAFISANPTSVWNLLGYLLVGFNSASPDIGVGGQITYKF